MLYNHGSPVMDYMCIYVYTCILCLAHTTSFTWKSFTSRASISSRCRSNVCFGSEDHILCPWPEDCIPVITRTVPFDPDPRKLSHAATGMATLGRRERPEPEACCRSPPRSPPRASAPRLPARSPRVRSRLWPFGRNPLSCFFR